MTPGPERCDLIVKGGQVLTLDARRTIYAAGAVAVRGHTIVAVGPEMEVLPRWHAADRGSKVRAPAGM